MTFPPTDVGKTSTEGYFRSIPSTLNLKSKNLESTPTRESQSVVVNLRLWSLVGLQSGRSRTWSGPRHSGPGTLTRGSTAVVRDDRPTPEERIYRRGRKVNPVSPMDLSRLLLRNPLTSILHRLRLLDVFRPTVPSPLKRPTFLAPS